MMQVCSALSHLHSMHIMHRDVKPENIMVDPATLNVKLIDFGFAKRLNEDPLTGYMVTRWYRPLEVVIGLKYDEKIDVFAAAVIYLELLKGKEIFQSATNMDQLNRLLLFGGYPS
jgi:serine/threonine protein kinase